MKKMLALVLCAVLLIGLFAGCSQDPADSVPTTTVAPTVVVDPTGTTLLYNNVMQVLEEQSYPKCFGGCYLAEHTNVLVILTTDEEELKSLLKDTLSNWETDCYRFQDANVAYEKLLEVHQQVQDNMDILNAMGVPITSIYIDVMNSRVAVGIQNLNSGSTKAITELVKSPLLYLFNSDGVSTD